MPARILTAALAALALGAVPQGQVPEPERPTAVLGAFADEVTRIERSVEKAEVREILGIRFVYGLIKGQPVVVASSGTGKVNAAMTATLLIDHFRPREVLFSGIAGAVHPDLHPGDIVIGEKTVQHDAGTLTDAGMERRGLRNPVSESRNPVFLEADARLVEKALRAAAGVRLEKIRAGAEEREPVVRRGIVATGDVFIASDAKKAELRSSLDASAVEMEGAAVAQVCRTFSIPWLVIRSISDSAGSAARAESDQFYPAAARNSARLVLRIIEELRRPDADRR